MSVVMQTLRAQFYESAIKEHQEKSVDAIEKLVEQFVDLRIAIKDLGPASDYKALEAEIKKFVLNHLTLVMGVVGPLEHLLSAARVGLKMNFPEDQQ